MKKGGAKNFLREAKARGAFRTRRRNGTAAVRGRGLREPEGRAGAGKGDSRRISWTDAVKAEPICGLGLNEGTKRNERRGRGNALPNYPARTRTLTKGTKIPGAAITPPGSSIYINTHFGSFQSPPVFCYPARCRESPQTFRERRGSISPSGYYRLLSFLVCLLLLMRSPVGGDGVRTAKFAEKRAASSETARRRAERGRLDSIPFDRQNPPFLLIPMKRGGRFRRYSDDDSVESLKGSFSEW